MRRRILWLWLALLLAGCERAPSTPAAPAGPLPVDVARVEPDPEPQGQVLPGRLEAFRTAEVRARVSGIVQRRLYEEGQEVQAGQTLFRIEPEPLQAAVAAAEAELAVAQAAAEAAADVAARAKRLLASDSISLQQYRQNRATAEQSQAQVRLAQAKLRSARLNLAYAEVTAPIAGRARRALVSEGALVDQNESTPLTRIEQLDPIYVNVAQPLAQALALRHALATQATPILRLRLPDGSLYAERGQLRFTDVAVDEATDTLALRAQFANPAHELLPGMYVEVLLALPGTRPAVLVPRQALVRDGDGSYVMCLEAGHAHRVAVTADTLRGERWRVTGGLQGGEQVILQAAALADGQAVAERTPQQVQATDTRPGGQG